MRAAISIVAALVCAGGCAGSKHATYAVSGGLMTGKAMLPPTSSSRTVNLIRYREIGGGFLTRTIMLLGTAPGGETITHVEDISCSRDDKGRMTGYCSQRVTTIWKPPSEEEVKAWVPTARMLLEDALPIELDIVGYGDFSLEEGDPNRSNGGGITLSTVSPVASVGKHRLITAAIGIKYENINFRGVNLRRASNVGAALEVVDEVAEISYTNLGFPIKLAYTLRGWAQVYAQYDWNLLGIFADDYREQRISPLRGGLSLTIPGFKYLYGTVEVISGGLSASRLSLMSEVGLVW